MSRAVEKVIAAMIACGRDTGAHTHRSPEDWDEAEDVDTFRFDGKVKVSDLAVALEARGVYLSNRAVKAAEDTFGPVKIRKKPDDTGAKSNE